MIIQWNLGIKDTLGQGVYIVLYKKVSFIRRLKCTGIIGIGTSRFVLIKMCSLFGVSFISGSTVFMIPYYLVSHFLEVT